MATQFLAEANKALESLELLKVTDISITSISSPVSPTSDPLEKAGFAFLNQSRVNSFSSSNSSIDSDDDDETLASSTELTELANQAKSRGLGKKVAVLGVGYVGLHLVEEFGQRHHTTAFDVSQARINAVTPSLVSLPLVKPTSNEADLAGAEYYLISVPTLVRPDETVDTSYIESALAIIAKYAQPGSTIIFESSVAIGTTRKLLAPLIESRGIKGGMSPERVDPGRTFPVASQIPKIISGLDDLAPGSLASIYDLYSTTFERVVPVSKPEVAEMTKLYENCQRMICIAYANEMADACIPLGIDPFEVCDAASTKPFGYSNYRPSAGVGGHCIPVNPFYLFTNCEFPLLHQATNQMKFRPAQIADRVMRDLYKKRRVSLTQIHSEISSRVLVVGVGFKAGQSVLSNSPGLAMARAFKEHWEADVEFADPMVPQFSVQDIKRMDNVDWNAASLSKYDAIVVVMKQHGLDFDILKNVEGPIMHNCCE